ncbi:MAG: helix-turn-helix domain-containing protein [Acidimicrobiales bacterium]
MANKIGDDEDMEALRRFLGVEPDLVIPRDSAVQLARAAVVDAGRRLFLDRGYGATTMEAISAEADVPPATVYRLFSSKHGILKALLDVRSSATTKTCPWPVDRRCGRFSRAVTHMMSWSASCG